VGRHGSAVTTPARQGSAPPGYGRLEGEILVLHAPRLAKLAREVHCYLAQGSGALAEMLNEQPPGLTALVVADEDWRRAPRETVRPYPPGLPYFTRFVEPPALVLPETLSEAFRPRTEATLPLTVWHELAHAFLLRGEVVKIPTWLGEFLSQAASAAVARRVGLPLEGHLSEIDRKPGYTVRSFRGPTGAAKQMAFQNLLLALGAAALEEFGEGFLGRVFRTLREEEQVVREGRAEELLAGALGSGGREWLASRPEF
jgi:hypothetical protein